MKPSTWGLESGRLGRWRTSCAVSTVGWCLVPPSGPGALPMCRRSSTSSNTIRSRMPLSGSSSLLAHICGVCHWLSRVLHGLFI